MQMSKLRSILWLIGGMAAAGAVVTIVAAVALPLGSGDDARSQGSNSNVPANNDHGPTTLPLTSFESAWQMPLRRPLVDAPTAMVADISPGTSAPTVRLIGTIVDVQHPRGIFLTGLSTVEMKTVGDTVGNEKILAIDENIATLESVAGTIILHREKKPFDPSGESYTAAAPASAPSDSSKDASE
jgi:hypothetical protein